MTLNELVTGDVAVIKEIDTKPDTKRRLMDIGLTRGSEIEILRFAPFGDPIEISVKDFCLALRRSDAKNITVRKITKTESDAESGKILFTGEKTSFGHNAESRSETEGRDTGNNRKDTVSQAAEVAKKPRRASRLTRLFRKLFHRDGREE